MNPTEKRFQNQYILYDGDLLKDADLNVFHLFDVPSLQSQNRIVGQAVGRGNTYFVNLDDCHGVLRHYRRGGFAAKISEDRYLWRSLYATRPWREWFLLSKLRDFDLNVPRPIAAHVVRFGLTYAANIMVERIEDAYSLSELLKQTKLTENLWRNIGTSIRRFHQRGVFHSDLNAHNIIINGSGEVYLIDFDKCYLRRTKRSWQLANLNRLHRSLLKIKNLEYNFQFCDDDWSQLISSYTQR